MYLFLFVILPLALSLTVQSILCRRAKGRLLRGGLVVLLLIPTAIGVIMLAGSDENYFGGLNAVNCLLCMTVSGSALCGYGLAWLLFWLLHR